MDEFIINSGDPVGEVVRRMIKSSGITQTQIASDVGMSKQCLTNRMRENKFYAWELVKIAELTGFVLTASQITKAKGVLLLPGIGRPCKQFLDKITYDTERSDAICHGPKTDGCFFELYRDKEKRFFVVQYTAWEGAKDHIVAISKAEAKKLYEKYGDGSIDDWFE